MSKEIGREKKIENKNKSCGKKVNRRDQRRIGMARTEENRAEFFPLPQFTMSISVLKSYRHTYTFQCIIEANSPPGPAFTILS